jgi:hypothetical protein
MANGRPKGFVAADLPDVFVSYARVDDDAVEGVETGWVTRFVRDLENSLQHQLGTRAFHVWMDHQLETNAEVTEEIMAKVRGSAALLVVLSPGFLNSRWCQRELKQFLDEVARRGGRGPAGVFLVELNEVDREQRPEALLNLNARSFWERDPATKVPRRMGFPVRDPVRGNDKPYWDLCERLGYDLSRELQARRERAAGVAAPAPPVATVFLAQVTEDLDRQRESVRDRLLQEGFAVLPEADRLYDRDEAKCREEVETDLKQAALFVQLLSGVPGRVLRGSTWTVAALQLDRAAALNVPRIRRRDRAIDPAVVEAEAPGHAALLQGPDVLTLGLEEFKAEVVKRLRALLTPPAAPPDRPPGKIVFVNAAPDDLALAAAVQPLLKQSNVAVDPPRLVAPNSPAELREYLQDKLTDCDGVLLIYGRCPPTWVSGQLRHSWKILAQRAGAPPALAVYRLPPPDAKQPVDFDVPNLLNLQGTGAPAAADLQPFFNTLWGGVAK